MAEKILTQHPEGKAGVNIARDKYDAVRDAIVDALSADGDMPYTQLAKAVEGRLPGFEGSVRWYAETVKLDLEARGLIQRVTGTRPQRLRLTGAR